MNRIALMPRSRQIVELVLHGVHGRSCFAIVGGEVVQVQLVDERSRSRQPPVPQRMDLRPGATHRDGGVLIVRAAVARARIATQRVSPLSNVTRYLYS